MSSNEKTRDNMSRRAFLASTLGLAGAATLSACGVSGGTQPSATKARVVVVGGGFGGATAAKYIRQFDPNIAVTMIDAQANHMTCPFSNLVLAGDKSMADITQTFDALRSQHGVKVVQGLVVAVDGVGRKVTLADGQSFAYDRLVLSPGIDFKYESIDGFTPEVAATRMPHAWQAGAQTLLLRRQLEAMPDGGVFVMSSPPNPFRCPPGPYERASLVASYFKKHKPKSKVLILDAKPDFSKQGLFEAGWKSEYPGMIEWVSKDMGGAVVGVDPAGMMVMADERHKASVANIIAPQKAGKIAFVAGLTDKTGWCPVDQKTYESSLVPAIHVVGDAAIAGPLPKSGYSANSEAKVCAAAIVALVNGRAVPEPSWVNTCYSLIAPDYGISVAAVYRLEAGKTVAVKGAGGISPADGNKRLEAVYAQGWYDAIVQDIWQS